jgi:hypothetical protein
MTKNKTKQSSGNSQLLLHHPVLCVGRLKSQNPLTAENAKTLRKVRKDFNNSKLALRPLRCTFAPFAVKKTF